MSDTEIWLEAARELATQGAWVKRDHASMEPRWVLRPPAGTPKTMIHGPVAEALLFIWGGNDGTDPLHDDFNARIGGPYAFASAVAVCESLAYDGTDGP